jgi:hypothetical protein
MPDGKIRKKKEKEMGGLPEGYERFSRGLPSLIPSCYLPQLLSDPIEQSPLTGTQKRRRGFR